MKQSGGSSAIEAKANVAKIKAEAERLDVVDKAAGILAELLYTDQLPTEIKQYRTVMLHVSWVTVDDDAGERKHLYISFV